MLSRFFRARASPLASLGSVRSITKAARDRQMNQLLSRTLNRSSAATISCTLVNSSGRVEISHGEFKRQELVARFGLLPRDLRKLDVSTHNIVPAILVRDSAIVVNLLQIRAIIKSDCVLLVDASMPSPETAQMQSLFVYDLEHRLQQPQQLTNLTYEQRALEAVLVSVVATLSGEYARHQQRVAAVLHGLEHSLDRKRLQNLLVESKTLGAFVQKARLIRDELEELIDNDRDLEGLCLSNKTETDSENDVEVMLESYYSQCDEVVQSAEHLAGNITSTEEYINILLDSNRNSLMMLEVRFQVGMLGLGAGSLLAALYGMNLRNMIEDSALGFIAVCLMVGTVAIASVAVGLRRLAKIGRIRNVRT